MIFKFVRRIAVFASLALICESTFATDDLRISVYDETAREFAKSLILNEKTGTQLRTFSTTTKNLTIRCIETGFRPSCVIEVAAMQQVTRGSDNKVNGIYVYDHDAEEFSKIFVMWKDHKGQKELLTADGLLRVQCSKGFRSSCSFRITSPKTLSRMPEELAICSAGYGKTQISAYKDGEQVRFKIHGGYNYLAELTSPLTADKTTFLTFSIPVQTCALNNTFQCKATSVVNPISILGYDDDNGDYREWIRATGILLEFKTWTDMELLLETRDAKAKAKFTNLKCHGSQFSGKSDAFYSDAKLAKRYDIVDICSAEQLTKLVTQAKEKATFDAKSRCQNDVTQISEWEIQSACLGALEGVAEVKAKFACKN